MDRPEGDNTFDNILHYTCGLCETICAEDEVEVHPFLNHYTEYFVDTNNYFYPRCDDGTVLRRSCINGEEVQVAESLLAENKAAGSKSREEPLIEAVKAREPLWNFRLPLAQRNKYTKDQLWIEICELLKGYYTVPEAKKKWKNLHDTFKKYDAQEKDVRSGSAAATKVKWQYFEIMKFVRDVNLGLKRTVSNIIPQRTDVDSEGEFDEDDAERSKSKTPRRSQQAIDKLVDALGAPLPEIVLPPPPPLPPAPAPPDRVDAFLMMIGHQIRAFDEPVQNEAMFKIHEFLYKLGQK